MSEKLKIAVITDWHPVDFVAFHKMFWRFDDFECYIQALDLFVADEANRDQYDAVVYYNLSIPLMDESNPIYQYMENIMGENGQGIFLLHHAICCYPGWKLWSRLSGIGNRDFKYHWDQTLTYQIDKPGHPIVKGMEQFTMIDESYNMDEPDIGENEVLISTVHPNSMKTIAWTRQFKNARVFCYESGHDHLAYHNENFLKILHDGILWCAGKI